MATEATIRIRIRKWPFMYLCIPFLWIALRCGMSIETGRRLATKFLNRFCVVTKAA